MGSRDFGFLTFRDITAYRPDNSIVPPNNVFVTSTNGSGVFSDNINISTINSSTINSNTINTSTLNASSILTNYLTVNSTLNASTIYTSTLYASNFISTNIIYMSSGIINGLNTISTYGTGVTLSIINPGDVGSASLSLFNGSTLITTAQTSSDFDGCFLEVSTTKPLFITNILDGTDNDRVYGYFSTINSKVNNNLYIYSHSSNDGIYNPSTGGSQNITIDINANDGDFGSIEAFYSEDYLIKKPLVLNAYGGNVGIGTVLTLNGTLSVQYPTGDTNGNVLHLSSNNNRIIVQNNNEAVGENGLSLQLLQNQTTPFGPSLHFNKSYGFNSTFSTIELGYVQFSGTNSVQSSVRGAYILAKQCGEANTFAPAELQFITNTSSIGDKVRMIISSNGNVGIGTTAPQYPLVVSSNNSNPLPFTSTFTVDNNLSLSGVAKITFEIIGAGGANIFATPTAGAQAGTGGYASGEIDIISGDTLELKIGNCNNTGVTVIPLAAGESSGTSLIISRMGGIKIPVIMGSGAGSGYAPTGLNSAGGHGGGSSGFVKDGNSGGFTNNIAIGDSGTNGLSPNWTVQDTERGYGGGVLTGDVVNLAMGGSGGSQYNGNNGTDGDNPDTIPPLPELVGGGTGGISADTMKMGGHGGGGYSGGGGGQASNDSTAGGGGGSSYIDFVNVNNVISFSGDYYQGIPIANKPIYPQGSPINNGLIRITFYYDTYTSISTDGDIECNELSCSSINVNNGNIGNVSMIGCHSLVSNVIHTYSLLGPMVQNEYWGWDGVLPSTMGYYINLGGLLVRWSNVSSIASGTYTVTFNGPSFTDHNFMVWGTASSVNTNIGISTTNYNNMTINVPTTNNETIRIMCIGQ